MIRLTVLAAGVLVFAFGSVAVVKGQDPLLPLHVAAASGKVDHIKQYIEKKADLNALDAYGYTPLKRAVESDQVEAAKVLLEGGANPNIKDIDGVTVLLPACQAGQKDIVDALLAAKADLTVKNRSGYTALHLAALMGYLEIAEALLNAGADVNATNGGGQTPLSIAKQRGTMPEMEELLTKHGGTVPAVDPRLGPYGEYGAASPQAGPSQSQVTIASTIDPNEIREELAKFTMLEAPLKVIDANGESEQRAWIVRRADNRTLLVRAVQKQFDEEMKFVKRLAVEEKAAKTAKAVDDLVAARKARYEQISQELREQRRQAAAESRETATTTTTGRGRGMTTRGTRGRSSTMAGGGTGQDPYAGTGQQARASRRSTTAQGPAQPALSAESEAQVQAWLSATTDSKADLLTTTHELDLAEYMALHAAAEEEKAAKTQVAVKALLMLREQRIAKIVVKWQEEDVRLQRIQERTGTDPTMQGTQQGTQQGTRRGRR
ncbi:MAG: ankyrin repeat domain-containing protein [Phycisphaerales bacterium]